MFKRQAPSYKRESVSILWFTDTHTQTHKYINVPLSWAPLVQKRRIIQQLYRGWNKWTVRPSLEPGELSEGPLTVSIITVTASSAACVLHVNGKDHGFEIGVFSSPSPTPATFISVSGASINDSSHYTPRKIIILFIKWNETTPSLC